MTVREATKLCFERYLNEFNLTLDLNILAGKALIEIESYPIDKLSRWLGFIQGYVIFTKQTTIRKERDFSRPLFHKAYEKENLIIPEPFSTKTNCSGTFGYSEQEWNYHNNED